MVLVTYTNNDARFLPIHCTLRSSGLDFNTTHRLAMFFSRQKDGDPAPYPDVPDSLHSDSLDTAAMQRLPEARASTAPYITPYLGLRARLSQIWINRWTVLLALVLVRVVLLIAQLNQNIGEAKTQALSACTNVENIGSAMASMPHYLSVGVDDLAAYGVEQAVQGMVDVLDLIMEGVSAMIIFFINFLTATYTCLITALIHGTLDVVEVNVKEATKDFNEVSSDVTSEIKSLSGGLQSDINSFISGIQNSFLGSALPKIPKVDFSEPINKLNSFSLNSDDFASDIRKLNNAIPTFSQVQNDTSEIISIPFNLVRQSLNDAFGGYTFQKDIFPTAQKQQLTFCSDNDTLNNFFDDLYNLVQKARIAFIVVIIILAVLVIAPMAWLETQRWRRQRKHAKLITKNQFDPMDVVYIASRPLTASWGIKLSSPFKGKRQILVRWCFAYATSTPAIFVLSLAVAGFFSCLCQFILLKVVQHEVPALTQEIGHFADEIVQALERASLQWATDANGVIIGLNNDINQHVLDYVVNATDAVNNTLNTFMTDMNNGLTDAFHGTVLLGPMQTVVNCVLGIKVTNIEQGLTWVHNNAHVSLPLFPNNTFSAGAKDSISGNSDLTTFLSTPSTATTDEVTGAVKHVTDWLHNNLVQEALVSTGILLVYVIVVLFGVTRMLAGMAMPNRGRAEGGLHYTGDGRPPLSPRSPEMDTEAAAAGTFPRFGSSSSEPDPVHASNGALSGDKVITPAPRTARARQVPGYDVGSSYGYVGTAEKI